MRLAPRVYRRRVYRNTIAFGAALLAGGAVLLIADIWLLDAASGLVRTILGLVDAGLFFFGAAYVLAGFYGLAKAKS